MNVFENANPALRTKGRCSECYKNGVLDCYIAHGKDDAVNYDRLYHQYDVMQALIDAQRPKQEPGTTIITKDSLEAQYISVTYKGRKVLALEVKLNTSDGKFIQLWQNPVQPVDLGFELVES